MITDVKYVVYCEVKDDLCIVEWQEFGPWFMLHFESVDAKYSTIVEEMYMPECDHIMCEFE